RGPCRRACLAGRQAGGRTACPASLIFSFKEPMTDNHAPPDPIARYRAVLDAIDPRLRLAAKLRALFPLIEPQVAAGVPHAAIMDDLAKAGLPVVRNTYITALRRWRRAKRLAAAEEAQNPATPQPVQPASPTA